MNFLAHAYLAGDDDPAFLAGNLMGDFVRGTPDPALPAAVRAGIRLHRRVDAFTDRHPVVRDARRRFPPPHRRAAGIILDMAFDHFLARDWASHHPTALPTFTRGAYTALERQGRHLPPRLAAILPRMRDGDWLAAYADFDSTVAALERMAARLSRRREMLRGAGPTLTALYPALEADFHAFFPALVDFVRDAGKPGGVQDGQPVESDLTR
ncbi:Acyl carrier protein phosphodiesterase [wastewater metagenome]|uniref:Acyl carrier protein phosphodiesterase n=4 Tax=root TaxID=1 RepID=A0A5B8RCD9_9ZZZZ|nr:acyl carrier protein phosphodiesterase [uncultured organism]